MSRASHTCLPVLFQSELGPPVLLFDFHMIPPNSATLGLPPPLPQAPSVLPINPVVRAHAAQIFAGSRKPCMMLIMLCHCGLTGPRPGAVGLGPWQACSAGAPPLRPTGSACGWTPLVHRALLS